MRKEVIFQKVKYYRLSWKLKYLHLKIHTGFYTVHLQWTQTDDITQMKKHFFSNVTTDVISK